MTASTGHTHPAPREVLDWVRARSIAPPACSISLCTHRALDLVDFGHRLADYLNEFDPEGAGSWRAFDCQVIRHAAGDPNLRQAIHDASQSFVEQDPQAPDFDQTVAGLGALGHAVLEGEACLTATQAIPNVFKVCLDCQATGPKQEQICDLWINAPRFDPKSHITAIGDSFLDWLSRRSA